MLDILGIAAIVIVALTGVVWLGFQVPFPDFRPVAGDPVPSQRYAIPTDLPAPVERYLRAVSLDGATLPRIVNATYLGHARARPFGVWLPVRHRVVVTPGRWFTREMEFPWYGLPLIRALDSYRGGTGETRLRGLVNGVTRGPHTDQGAYLALASESVMLPSVEALQGRWEGVDDTTARLHLPYRQGEETLEVHFDPATGLPTEIRAQRYKGEDEPKVGWRVELSDYRERGGLRIATHVAVVWEDVGQPWSVWEIDRLALNVGVPAPALEAQGAESLITSATPTAP